MITLTHRHWWSYLSTFRYHNTGDRVWGGGGIGECLRGEGVESFWQEYSLSPVTAVNKAEKHLTFKLLNALIFNQLNHSLLRCKLYLNLHIYRFFLNRSTKSSPPISISGFCHCYFPKRWTHTHTHTHTHKHKRYCVPDQKNIFKTRKCS